MAQDTAFPRRPDTVRFFAPDWDEEETNRHAADLAAMGRYARVAARGHGLDADEVADDLNGRFGHLGAIQVGISETSGRLSFWIEILADGAAMD